MIHNRAGFISFLIVWFIITLLWSIIKKENAHQRSMRFLFTFIFTLIAYLLFFNN